MAAIVEDHLGDIASRIVSVTIAALYCGPPTASTGGSVFTVGLGLCMAMTSADCPDNLSWCCGVYAV